MALEKIEPFGERGAWLRSALTTCILANAHRSKETPAFKLEDFLPENLYGEEEKPAQTPDQMFQIFMLLKAHQDAILDRQRLEKLEQEGRTVGNA